jgi:OOP family OmpA-OmpF porin
MRTRFAFALLALLLLPALAAAQARLDPAAPCYRWPAVDMDDDGVFDRVDHCVNTPKGCTVDEWGCESDADGDGVCDGLDRCPNTPAGMKVDEQGCHEGAGAMGDASGTAAPRQVEPPRPAPVQATKPVSEVERQLIETGTIRLENVYFETASSKLLPESESILREVGETLEKFPTLRIEIEGHTDTRGWATYNMRLSQARAEAVRAFLLEYFQLEDGHYVAKGYGETRPETDERNDEELLRNRRVVLRALNPGVLPRGVKVEEGAR